MRNKMFKMLLVVGVAAGLLAGVAPAQAAGEGCVTYNEATRTLTDGAQSRTEIQRGFGATPKAVVRHGENLIRASYQPCRYPRQAFAEVIYTRNREGQWKSFFWVYYLYSPGAYRATTDTWSAHTL